MKNSPLILLLIFNLSFVSAQKEVVDFLQTPEIIQDAASTYLNPMTQMLGSNLQASWYNSAKTHRFLGFDVSIGMSSSATAATQRGYHLNQVPGFDENYKVKDGSFSIAANVAGKTESHPTIINRLSGREIQLPRGEGQDKVKLPIISGGLGLPYNTELRVKLMPKIDKDGMGNLFQYGLGIKHSVKEYLPGINKIPAISLAIFGAYSSISSDASLHYASSSTSVQQLNTAAKAYTGRLLLGFDVPVFSAFMGLGYSSSSVEYALKGNYFVGDVLNETEEKDPLTINYDLGTIALDFGLKAKLGMVQVFAAYSPGAYANFSFGVGIHVM
ncbi:DUF6588 family protein [Saccharicrinis carchari]|nr:DUF6588 family protein [Saccharicrinis carchari]